MVEHRGVERIRDGQRNTVALHEKRKDSDLLGEVDGHSLDELGVHLVLLDGSQGTADRAFGCRALERHHPRVTALRPTNTSPSRPAAFSAWAESAFLQLLLTGRAAGRFEDDTQRLLCRDLPDESGSSPRRSRRLRGSGGVHFGGGSASIMVSQEKNCPALKEAVGAWDGGGRAIPRGTVLALGGRGLVQRRSGAEAGARRAAAAGWCWSRVRLPACSWAGQHLLAGRKPRAHRFSALALSAEGWPGSIFSEWTGLVARNRSVTLVPSHLSIELLHEFLTLRHLALEDASEVARVSNDIRGQKEQKVGFNASSTEFPGRDGR